MTRYAPRENRIVLLGDAGLKPARHSKAIAACTSDGPWRSLALDVCVTRSEGPAPRPIFSPRDVADLIRKVHPEILRSTREHLLVIPCANLRPLGVATVAVGGASGVGGVTIADVLRPVVAIGADEATIVHNHPRVGSDSAVPSRADGELTRAVIEGARALSITIHDHIVISADGHYRSALADHEETRGRLRLGEVLGGARRLSRAGGLALAATMFGVGIALERSR